MGHPPPAAQWTVQEDNSTFLHVRTLVRTCFCSEGALIEKVDHRKTCRTNAKSQNTKPAGNTAAQQCCLKKQAEHHYILTEQAEHHYILTEQLLDTLDRYGVHVTFFVTGAFPDCEDMIKKEDAAGHSVGIHTLTHDFAKIYSSDKAFWKDIDKMQAIVQKQTGHTTNLMRFAGGSSNSISADYTPGIMTLLTKQAAQKGFQYFDWNISSGDGGAEGDMNMVIKNITSQLPNQDTCVVLCHDTKEYAVKAMEYLIPWLLDHGYSIQPLQFDSEPAHHGVQN